MAPAGLVQRGQEQMIAGERAAGYRGPPSTRSRSAASRARCAPAPSPPPGPGGPACRGPRAAVATCVRSRAESAQPGLGAAAGGRSASRMCSAPMASCRGGGPPPARAEHLLRAGTKGARVDRGVIGSPERLGFVDEHDGDAVLHRVDEPAAWQTRDFGLRPDTPGRPCTWGRPGSRGAQGPGSCGLLSGRGWGGKSEPGSAAGLLAPVGQHLHPGVEIDRARRAAPRAGARAWAPMALMVAPPRPITMAFCDSRSTNSVTRMYIGRSASRNSSTSAVKAYGSSSLQQLEGGFAQILDHEEAERLGADVVGIELELPLGQVVPDRASSGRSRSPVAAETTTPDSASARRAAETRSALV